MATRFTLPAVFTKTDLSESTKKQYKTKLNTLAKHGITSVEDILAPARRGVPSGLSKTAKIVRDLSPDNTEKGKHERRFYLSAINWVLPRGDYPPLYTLYKRSDPETNLRTGEPWVDKKYYKPPSE
jgi:hypothetical protein